MSALENKPKVLLVGESWVSYSAHFKGFNFFPTAFYEEGFTPLREALDGVVHLSHMPAHLAATQFPSTIEDLQAFDVILFSDIGSDTLLLHPDTFIRLQVTPNRLRLVQEYVKKGGGFGMIGWYMSFGGYEGKAHYHGSPIEEILPVKIAPYDDRVETPEGIRPKIVQDHPIVKGIKEPWPPLLGYNRLQAKDGAQILLQHEQDPLLVINQVERGRTIAYASDISPHWGSESFVSWEHYPTFWRQLIAWLAGA